MRKKDGREGHGEADRNHLSEPRTVTLTLTLTLTAVLMIRGLIRGWERERDTRRVVKLKKSGRGKVKMTSRVVQLSREGRFVPPPIHQWPMANACKDLMQCLPGTVKFNARGTTNIGYTSDIIIGLAPGRGM